MLKRFGAAGNLDFACEKSQSATVSLSTFEGRNPV